MLRWAMSGDKSSDYEQDNRVPIGYATTKSANSVRPNAQIDEYNQGFNFTVFNATGGKVIRVHSIDTKTDRHVSNLYIITDKEDFGEELAQIITRDSLSR